MDTFWYLAVPYAALAVFVVGHVWRYRVDQFGWTTRTSQLFERRWLAWGSPLFHVGALLAIAGHAAGLLLPASWTSALGISEHAWHVTAVAMGTVAGVLVVAGLAILIIRRFLVSTRVRVVTTKVDVILYILLAVEITLGMVQTVGVNLLGGGYDYRESVAVWFRGIFYGQPDIGLIASAPLVYRLHAVTAFLLLAVWPFTRLVHVWSVPLAYLARPFVVYRRRSQT
jgi:nitrate reductase gamma subunit